jgi:DNA repair and recombination protein RAD52
MFTQEQIDALSAPLSKSHVKQNPRGYSYVEGWHAIAEANRIFGFDGWDRQTIDMRQLGEPEQDGKGNWRVAYHCRVRITVRGVEGVVITRDGSGYGSGIVKDIRDAHESAIKEAETDAMKRALMTFGNPFGLALYDKEQVNVSDDGPSPANKYIAECWAHIDAARDEQKLKLWWNAEEQKTARRTNGLTPAQVSGLMETVKTKLAKLQAEGVAA